MSRSLEEWIGRSDDDQVPPRVRIRVFQTFGGICRICDRKIIGKRWICDHTIALVNGGENRENNLGPIHEDCDRWKTAADVAEKSRVYRKTAKHLGVKLRQSRPMPGSRASGLRKRMDGTVERRRTGKIANAVK